MTREPPLPLEWDCASCAALEAEVARLQAENDKLRTEADHAIRMAELWKEKARRALEPKP